MEVTFLGDEGGPWRALIALEPALGTGVVDLEDTREFDFHAIAPSTSRSRLKVNEADYFLKLARRFVNHEAALHYNLGAFATAICSFTDVLANEMRTNARGRDPASTWLQVRKKKLQGNEAYGVVREFRNFMVHRGQDPPTLDVRLVFRQHLSGERTIEHHVQVHRLGRKGPEDPFKLMDECLALVRGMLEVAERRGYIPQVERSGHRVTIDCLEEKADGEWVLVDPRGMEMFGHRAPEMALGTPVMRTDIRADDDTGANRQEP